MTEPSIGWQAQLLAVQRLQRLVELYYRRWRFEQRQSELSYRVSWEKLKQKILILDDNSAVRRIERLEATVELRTVAAANLWRSVSYPVAPVPSD